MISEQNLMEIYFFRTIFVNAFHWLNMHFEIKFQLHPVMIKSKYQYFVQRIWLLWAGTRILETGVGLLKLVRVSSGYFWFQSMSNPTLSGFPPSSL